TALGKFGEVLYSLSPSLVDRLLHLGYRVFPDSAAAKGQKDVEEHVSFEQIPAIEVTALRKRYGDFEALRGIDITVRRGEVFGLLGPNGAGKTTTVEILEGYRARSGGEVSVLGHDPALREIELRRRIGIVLQSGGIYSQITPREAL